MQATALRTAALAMAALVPSAGAPAQERFEGPARHRLGPLRYTVRLQLRNLGVDTNVFHSFSDPVRDHEAVLGARADGALALGRRLEISGTGFVEQFHFRRVGEAAATDFYGEGRADLDLGSLRLFGGGGGGRFTQRYSIDVDERLPRQEERALAGVELLPVSRLSLTAQASAEVITFGAGTFRLGGDVKEAMDRNTLAVTGEVRYSLTPRTTLLVSADAFEDQFFSQPPDLPRIRRSYRYLGGVELGERAIVTGRLLVGMREFPGTLAQGSPSYRGPVGNADLTVPLGRLARLRLQGLRDVYYASSLVDVGALRYRNAFVYQLYRGETLLPLSPSGLAAVVFAGFEKARYLLPYPYVGRRLYDRVDFRYTAGAGLVQPVGQTLRIGAHLSWERRVSSLPTFGYEGLRYGVSAELVP